jgi:hypothetical protein
VIPVVVVLVVVPIPFVFIPAMIVLDLTIVAGPIPCIKLLPFVARAYPRRALVRRPGVVSGVPSVSIVV